MQVCRPAVVKNHYRGEAKEVDPKRPDDDPRRDR